MKYSVSARQPYSVLKKADEVMVNTIDRDIIIDYVEKIPDKRVVLKLTEDLENYELWKMYDEKLDSFYIALCNLYKAKDLNENGIKWFWPYPITSYYELVNVVALGASMVDLGPPLSFDLENVKKIIGDVKIRMSCNCARPAYLPDELPAANLGGQWVRPEDVEAYGEYVDTFYFEDVELTRESTLLHIYKDNQNWPGNLNLLIDKLGYNVDNRVIPEELGSLRRNCKQRCLSGGACRLCLRGFEFATKIRKEKFRREREARELEE